MPKLYPSLKLQRTMIYSSKHILYAIELRVLSLPYAGSLCVTTKKIDRALSYFDIKPWRGYFANPYCELSSDLISQMDKPMLRLFNSYIELCNPRFTNDELYSIIEVCRKYKYAVINHRNRISIRSI